ncbi:polysaccharide deacetylase family protein [Paenibacillus qinlingensis]|uniref:polysaccharide deacetylase family protein n=1 Tax=Paenibacillus qinlingensis TaxID=1837343 RepID=UPI001565B6AC|nr:polysaccharide deacetylase family protein [Paenibacillus qinlingensis]NQX59946.1 polysaccharide deacetylase family protein [Paenibacillus qinlingensis]
MIVRFAMERKQYLLLGIVFSGVVGMTFLNYTVTGQVLPIPLMAKTIMPEAGTPQIQQETKPASQEQGKHQERNPLPSPKVESAEHTEQLSSAAAKLGLGSQSSTSQTKSTVGRKKIALSFDDGPDHKYTPQVLDILKKSGIKATFFVVGDQVRKYPDVLRRIYAEGHAIGNHTWDHADLSKLSIHRVNEEIKRTDDYVKQILGVPPSMVRAPYGAVTSAIKREVELTGRPLVSWDVDPKDWAGTSSSNILQNIQMNAKAGSIILLHSFGGKQGKLDNTIEALPKIITFLQKNDFQLMTVPEMNFGVKGTP